MSIRQAAEQLLHLLEHHTWLMTVGIGAVGEDDAIYIFIRKAVKSRQLDELKQKGWQGFPVIIEKSGSPRPAKY